MAGGGVGGSENRGQEIKVDEFVEFLVLPVVVSSHNILALASSDKCCHS